MTHAKKLFPQVGSKGQPTQAWHIVQTAFLTNLVHNQIPVAIYLTTGIKKIQFQITNITADIEKLKKYVIETPAIKNNFSL